MSLGFLFWSALGHRVTRAISQQSLASHVIPRYRSPTLLPHKNFHGFSSGFTVWIFLINCRQRLHYGHEQNGPNFYEWPGFWPSFVFGRRMCFKRFFGVNGNVINLYHAIYIGKSGVVAIFVKLIPFLKIYWTSFVLLGTRALAWCSRRKVKIFSRKKRVSRVLGCCVDLLDFTRTLLNIDLIIVKLLHCNKYCLLYTVIFS